MPEPKKPFLPAPPSLPPLPEVPAFNPAAQPENLLLFIKGMQDAIKAKQAALQQVLGVQNPSSAFGPLAEIASATAEPFISPSVPSPALAYVMGPQAYNQQVQNNAQLAALYAGGAPSFSSHGRVAGMPGIPGMNYTPGVRAASDMWKDDLRKKMAMQTVDSLGALESGILDLQMAQAKQQMLAQAAVEQAQREAMLKQYQAALQGALDQGSMLQKAYGYSLQDIVSQANHDRNLSEIAANLAAQREVIRAREASEMAKMQKEAELRSSFLEKEKELEDIKHKQGLEDSLTRILGGFVKKEDDGSLTVYSRDGIIKIDPNSGKMAFTQLGSPISAPGDKQELPAVVPLNDSSVLLPDKGLVLDFTTGWVSKAEEYVRPRPSQASSFVQYDPDLIVRDPEHFRKFVTDYIRMIDGASPDLVSIRNMDAKEFFKSMTPQQLEMFQKMGTDFLRKLDSSGSSDGLQKTALDSLLRLSNDALRIRDAITSSFISSISNRNLGPGTGTSKVVTVAAPDLNAASAIQEQTTPSKESSAGDQREAMEEDKIKEQLSYDIFANIDAQLKGGVAAFNNIDSDDPDIVFVYQGKLYSMPLSSLRREVDSAEDPSRKVYFARILNSITKQLEELKEKSRGVARKTESTFPFSPNPSPDSYYYGP